MRGAHAFALLLCAALVACGERPADETARLLERSAARWAHVTRGEWVESYDSLSPTVKGWLSMEEFLQGKRMHRYEDPGRPELIGIDMEHDHVAYVRVNVKWSSSAPAQTIICFDRFPEEYGQDRIEAVETWEWLDGEWWMRWPMSRPSDFFADHPELLRARAGSRAQ
jgi:hypothetical protein